MDTAFVAQKSLRIASPEERKQNCPLRIHLVLLEKRLWSDMPYLSIHTSSSLSDEQQTALLGAASKVVASELNKPESYVMVSLVNTQKMKFAGEDGPSAFLHLSSIGVPESQRNPLISALTKLVAETFNIMPDRIFIVLEDVQAKLWGWNGATIG